jgi:hypothetical protein
VARDRVRKLLAGFYVGFEADDDFLERRVLGLLRDALEGGAEVDAGLDHDGELLREVEDVLLLGAAGVELAELREEVGAAEPGHDGRDRQHVHALVAQEGRGGGHAVRGDHAHLNLVAAGTDLIAVVGHGVLRP